MVHVSIRHSDEVRPLNFLERIENMDETRNLVKLTDEKVFDSVLDIAFKETALQFAGQSYGSKRDAELSIKSYSNNSLRDVQCAIKDCIARCEARSPDSKALKWLRQLSEKVVYYEGVVDVVIQQHPEAVSLIWGGMKFFFLVSLPRNDEELPLVFNVIC